MNHINRIIRLGVIFLGRKRPGFDPEWGQSMNEKQINFLKSLPFESEIWEKPVVDDTSLRNALENITKRKCDVLVVLQTTMSDGRMAPILAQHWQSPVVLWATPENPDGNMISSCSLVGVHTFAATMRQLGHSFEIAYGGAKDEIRKISFEKAVYIAHAKHALSKAKAGLIGYHAPGFIDMHADPGDLSRALGIQLQHYGLEELIDIMQKLPDDMVKTDIQEVEAMNLPMDKVSSKELEIQSRYYLAFRQLINEDNLDTFAIRCWSELPSIVGQWPYFAMVRLTNEGIPNAMEGDIDGAITCLLGKNLGTGNGYLSDWLEHTRDTITLWHPGNAPFEICPPVGTDYCPTLTRHFNNDRPMVVAARLLPNHPITLSRLWRCDNRYYLTARDARTIQVERDLQGTNGLAKLDNGNVFEWFEELCYNGMPHHIAVFPGHYTLRLKGFARQAGVKFID